MTEFKYHTMALRAMGFMVNDQQTDLIITTLQAVKDKYNKLTLMDIAKIKAQHEEKYEIEPYED